MNDNVQIICLYLIVLPIAERTADVCSLILEILQFCQLWSSVIRCIHIYDWHVFLIKWSLYHYEMSSYFWHILCLLVIWFYHSQSTFLMLMQFVWISFIFNLCLYIVKNKTKIKILEKVWDFLIKFLYILITFYSEISDNLFSRSSFYTQQA